MVRMTAICAEFLPVLCFELGFQCFCHFVRRALSLLLVAPFPLCQIVVGRLQSALGGKNIHLSHKSVSQHDSHIVDIIFGLDLSRNFLPKQNLVSGHSCHSCAASCKNKSTAAEALAPYPSAPISSANI